MSMPPMQFSGSSSSGVDTTSSLSQQGGNINFGSYYGGGANSGGVHNPWVKPALIVGGVVVALAYLKGRK